MISAIVRFRPTGPWRFGPDSGVRDRVDLIYHSDSLYSAVTSAMQRLGLLEEWLDATARKQDSAPDVRFSSMFPFQRDVLLVPPPRSLWPPPPTTKVRFKSARFVPMSVVQALIGEQPVDENRWVIDGECQCMISSGEGPFRVGIRGGAAIDRLNPSTVDPHVTACIEFGRDAGLWAMVVYESDEARQKWHRRVRSAFRLLADTGFGGERSRGWGRSEEPQWRDAPSLWAAPETEKAHWLLSLYSPAPADAVDWKSGSYSTITRTGRIESIERWGELKTPSVLIAEGSVLVAPESPRGVATDIAPRGFAHPVFRSGFAVSIPIPWKVPGAAAPPAQKPKPVAVSVPEVTPVPETIAPPSSPQENPAAPEPVEPPAAPEPETTPVPVEPAPTPQPEPAEPSAAPEREPTPPPAEPAPTPEPEPAEPSAAPEPETTPPPAEPARTPEPEQAEPSAAPEPQPTPLPAELAPTHEPESAEPSAAPEPETTPAPAEPASTHEPDPAEPSAAPEPEPAPAPDELKPELPEHDTPEHPKGGAQ